jgi:phosphoglucosamine mutase
MKSLFGTDGIRGEAGKFPLDAPTVNLIGASLARYLKTVSSKSPSIIIGATASRRLAREFAG